MLARRLRRFGEPRRPRGRAVPDGYLSMAGSAPRNPGTGGGPEGAAGSQVARLTTGLAALVAALIGIAVPVVFFYFGYMYDLGSLRADADLRSRLLADLIANKPAVWDFEAEKLGRLLTAPRGDAIDRVHRIYDARGELLIQAPSFVDEETLKPVIVESLPLVVNGRTMGWIEASSSLRPLLWRTAFCAVIAAMVAACTFVALRIVPLRALRGALDRVSYLATHDVLTGLSNRAMFRDRLDDELALVRRRGDTSAVLYLDLDHFKEVNDTLGHAIGDLLLREATVRLRGCTRASDTLARLGGDEFAIIQRGLHQPPGASVLAGRIVDVFSTPFVLDGNEVLVGCSVGIALATAESEDSATLLRNADLALYRAKNEGRNTFRFFEEEMNAELQARKALEYRLRRAIARDEFQVYYQPQLRLGDRGVVGVEALLRWFDPDGEQVSPEAFIPLAEETGLIHPLSELVLRRACTDALVWPSLSVAVNLSAVQFRQPGLVDLVERILAETGLDARRLELEITETVLLQDTDTTYATLEALKRLGVRVALDDFGTGYSSLTHLRRFQFDKVKIDRSFVRDLGGNGEAEAIVRAVIALGHSLGMRSNAEGVETLEQAAFLSHQGCQEVQGFLYARPMPSDDIVRLMDEEHPAA